MEDGGARVEEATPADLSPALEAAGGPGDSGSSDETCLQTGAETAAGGASLEHSQAADDFPIAVPGEVCPTTETAIEAVNPEAGADPVPVDSGVAQDETAQVPYEPPRMEDEIPPREVDQSVSEAPVPFDGDALDSRGKEVESMQVEGGASVELSVREPNEKGEAAAAVQPITEAAVASDSGALDEIVPVTETAQAALEAPAAAKVATSEEKGKAAETVQAAIKTSAPSEIADSNRKAPETMQETSVPSDIDGPDQIWKAPATHASDAAQTETPTPEHPPIPTPSQATNAISVKEKIKKLQLATASPKGSPKPKRNITVSAQIVKNVINSLQPPPEPSPATAMGQQAPWSQLQSYGEGPSYMSSYAGSSFLMSSVLDSSPLLAAANANASPAAPVHAPAPVPEATRTPAALSSESSSSVPAPIPAAPRTHAAPLSRLSSAAPAGRAPQTPAAAAPVLPPSTPKAIRASPSPSLPRSLSSSKLAAVLPSATKRAPSQAEIGKPLGPDPIPQTPTRTTATAPASVAARTSPTLHKLKGKKKIFLTRCPLHVSELTNADVFLLELPAECRVILWYGKECGKVKRVKAKEVAVRVLDREWAVKVKPILAEIGRNVLWAWKCHG
ncbi:hypothetical protein BDK51DRAFT_28630 [Blyttiomyces helicus]|uniref:Gelsolin-like domain-containing protein n=1 Tax=Blyttiomyces helicus TaxID=388810 RepID=A0A4P9W885_9FUNG|nr:hypothetical protein BDK51DRAFT_28630 [Blyttiomyces helicus]|eukprot:RKO87278.1 hypothetical protein BDK51DRAFT_28630 [Blyttiomyces helicus]